MTTGCFPLEGLRKTGWVPTGQCHGHCVVVTP